MTRTALSLPSVLSLLLAVWLAAVAPAQDPGDPTAPLDPFDTTPATSDAAGEVGLRVLDFGVGGWWRPGDWAGVQLEILDTAERPRNIVLRLHTPDPDGDTAWMQRVVVTNPGAKQPVWLYLRIPFEAARRLGFTVTAHEALERDPTAIDQRLRYEAGRVLGRLSYAPATSRFVSSSEAMMLVVGRRDAGLHQYGWHRGNNEPAPPGGHEHTNVVSGLAPANLPDRWMGYWPYEAVVWTGSGAEEQPLRLSEGQTEALREWVRRGGHLIVILPSVGQTWFGSSNVVNPLSDILPRVTVERAEGVDLKAYRPLLTRDAAVALPTRAVVHTFTPDPNAGPFDAMPIFKGPGGETVATRRIVGMGAVTVLGLDPNSRGVADTARAFDAQIFWHRLLGKQQHLISEKDLAERQQNVRSSGWWVGQQRPRAVLDAALPAAITRQGKVSAGLLLAFVVFGLYWVAAGPGSYYLLKQRRRKHHAWLAFVGAAAVFTGLSWGGAALLKEQRVQGKHLTIIDGVYGQTNHRARVWCSVLLPTYGDTPVSVRAPEGSAFPWHNALAAWDSPTDSGWASFPDARGYVVDARAPDSIDFPSRATVKQLQIDWCGVLPDTWAMPRPAHTQDAAGRTLDVGREIRLVEDTGRTGQSGTRSWRLTGSIVHNLPAPLTDVRVYLIRQPVRLGVAPGSPLAEASANALGSTREWKPGEPLDLDATFPQTGDSSAARQLMTIRGKASRGQFGVGFDELTRPIEIGLEAATFFSVLPPPHQAEAAEPQAIRTLTHGLDLSRWFTQPCVVVLGHVRDAECPVPIEVGGLEGETVRRRLDEGLTLVRWVYPLEARPTVVPAREPAADTPAEGPEPVEPGA